MSEENEEIAPVSLESLQYQELEELDEYEEEGVIDCDEECVELSLHPIDNHWTDYYCPEKD